MTILRLSLACSLLLAGCVTKPQNQTERTDSTFDLPKNYQAETLNSPEIAKSLLEIFDNEKLRDLTNRALANNPDLLSAYAQLEESGFNLKTTKSGLFPSLEADGSGTRSKSSSGTTNTYTTTLDASWEVDVWGSIRNDVKASRSDYLATQASYESVKQSLVAQTMQAWFNLLSAAKLMDLAERERDSFASTEDLVERRYERGTSTIAELELARTDASNARADYHASVDTRNQAARSLKALLGDYPDDDLLVNDNWPSLDKAIPVDLPSDLLLARPDIRAAYEGIRAADARVNVAYADLFPSFSLTAYYGRSSDTLSDLSKSGFDIWSIAGQIVAPLYQGGKLRAGVGAAGKRAEAAYQNYRSVALNAFREVEDALGSEYFLEREEESRLEALAAAKRAEKKTLQEYEEGLSDIISLLEAQRRVFSTEQQTITLRSSRLINRVSLALALGKGV